MRPLSDADFESLVAEALDTLPVALAERMSNVEVTIEEMPGAEAGEFRGDANNLLGLYHGIPLTDRTEAYSGVLPDRITLYKKNLERRASTKEELREAVRHTVIHEVAHHFGIDDDRLEELGRY